MQKRCEWVPDNKQHYIDYHDIEWGVPLHDDQKLFEMLILEGAQAGLNWETVLKKRENYKKAFDNFDPKVVAEYSEDKINELLQDEGIIRNRLKVNAAVKNAIVYLDIQKEFGSFASYLWGYVDGQPIINQWSVMKDVPASTDLSDKISKDLKKRGMSFVGSTIIYAYMQAIGMVNDHTTDCFRYQALC